MLTGLGTSFVSSPDGAELPPGLTLSSATLTGLGEVGETLTITYEAMSSDPPITAAYTWFRNGSPIAGAETSSYLLVEADAEATITAILLLTDDAAHQESANLGPITVAALPTTGTEVLNHNGAEFTVTEVSETGVFADGSPWAVVGSASTITQITPASTSLASRTLSNGTTAANMIVHGAMKNPGNATASFPTQALSTLGQRQALNGFGGTQGYDSFEGTSGSEMDYAALSNIDPGATGSAFALNEGTVVKAISKLADVPSNGRPTIDEMGVLTVLPTAPATNAFRPPFAFADKTAHWTVGDLNLSVLPNLSAAGIAVPSAASVLEWASVTHTHQHTYNVLSRNVVPHTAHTLSPYAGFWGEQFGQAMLALCLDAWTPAEKEAVTIKLVQMGIDVYGRAREGGIWQDNGGHCTIRKSLLIFAAQMLASPELLTVAKEVARDINDPLEATPIGASIYADDTQFFTISQADIDRLKDFPYTQDMLGWPEWSGDATRKSPDEITQRQNTLGVDANGTQYRQWYRQIIAKQNVPAALGLRLMGFKDAFANQVFFDYQDRHVAARLAAGQAFTESGVVANDIAAWVLDAWQIHRGTEGLWTPITQNPESTRHVVGIFGQSELEYLVNPSNFYTQIPAPVPSEDIITIYTDTNSGAVQSANIVKTFVSSTTVSGDLVNPVVANWASFLEFARPGHSFVLADLSVQGTSRYDLMDDANTDRGWSELEAMVNTVRAAEGEIGHVIECWYNSDAGSLKTFGESFAPFYFGQAWDGSAFTLGNTNPDAINSAAIVDHCLWDVDAASDAKGRGLFARDDTKLHLLWPMPFHDTPVAPSAEWTNFSTGGGRVAQLDRPARDAMITWSQDARVASFLGSTGPSAHITQFSGGIHPDVTDPDGQIFLGWPFAVAMLRASGMTLHEPTILSISTAADGSYADIEVDLPNGGDLTTIRALENRAAPSTPPPHIQEVVGFEIHRSGTADSDRRPVIALSETSYPSSSRGTVSIQDIGTGTVPNRRGVVRITPEEPFVNGDGVEYLRGQASAHLLEPRDVDAQLYLDMLIEHVPSLHDANAMYPFPGLAIRPQPQELLIADVGSVEPDFFTTSGTGPYFLDPVNIPANTTAIRHVFQFRIPASISLPSSSFLTSIASQGFDLRIIASGGGRVNLQKLEDNTGAQMMGSTTIFTSIPRDTWITLEVMADHSTDTLTATMTDASSVSLSYTGTSSGNFASNRKISLMSNTAGSFLAPAGIDVALLETHFTTNGTESLRVQIQGDAASVNAHPWRQGDPGT